MEYKGKVTKENEQFVREIEAMPDFNNGFGNLPNGIHRKQYKIVRDYSGKEKARDIWRENIPIWKKLFSYVVSDRKLYSDAKEIIRLENNARKSISGVFDSLVSSVGDVGDENKIINTNQSERIKREKERANELFIPFYIFLRKQGFSRVEICGADCRVNI